MLIPFPLWMVLVYIAFPAIVYLGVLLVSDADAGLKWRTYVQRWLQGWRIVHSEWVAFSVVEEVKPIDLFSPRMKELIEQYGGMDCIKISATGYFDWDTGLAHKCYTLWAQPKKRSAA
jgi:hypothetical protein